MSKFDSKQLIEALGVLGIIASLIFVGAQLMLDRRIAVGNQYHNRAILLIENARARRDNPAIIASRAKSWDIDKPNWWTAEIDEYIDRNELTMEEVAVRFFEGRISVRMTDNNLFQYELIKQ